MFSFVRRLAVALGFALLVAFAPSTAWADSGSFALGLAPSVESVAAAPVGQAAASAPAAAYYVGSPADPVNVVLPVDFAAAVLLGLGLCVFFGAALLVSTWGN